MRTKELSEYLEEVWGIRLSPATLHKLRCQSGGVPFQKDGNRPVSTPAQADVFAAKRLGPERTSTSDIGQQLRLKRYDVERDSFEPAPRSVASDQPIRDQE
jgi:hypothetical protein